MRLNVISRRVESSARDQPRKLVRLSSSSWSSRRGQSLLARSLARLLACSLALVHPHSLFLSLSTSLPLDAFVDKSLPTSSLFSFRSHPGRQTELISFLKLREAPLGFTRRIELCTSIYKPSHSLRFRKEEGKTQIAFYPTTDRTSVCPPGDGCKRKSGTGKRTEQHGGRLHLEKLHMSESGFAFL